MNPVTAWNDEILLMILGLLHLRFNSDFMEFIEPSLHKTNTALISPDKYLNGLQRTDLERRLFK
jgi:hypothetical protein